MTQMYSPQPYAIRSGERLSHVVVPLQGTIKREITVFKEIKKTKNGQSVCELQKKVVTRPAGYMVYFPRGHVLRLTEKRLKDLGLHGAPHIVNLEGLLGKKGSPLGDLLSSQDEAGRGQAFRDLQNETIELATRRSGKDLLVRDVTDFEERSNPMTEKVALTQSEKDERKSA